MSFTRFNSNSSFKRFSQPISTDQYDTTALDNQIGNANTRIQDAGYTPAKTDKRNWFEKLTNLPQKQNFLFDALELLGRPAQAVLGAVHSKQTGGSGKDALNAALSGVSGKERTRGVDLLENTNIKSPLAKTIIGTGLEVALDPLMYVPGAALTKAISAPAKLTGSVLRGSYKAAEKVIPKFGQLSETQIRPAAEKVKDSLGYMFKPDYKKTETLTGGSDDFLKDLERGTENSRNFMKDEYMNRLADTAKLAGGIDTGVDVGRIMEKDLKQFEDVKGFEFPDGIRRTTDKNDLINEVANNKLIVSTLGKQVNQSRKAYETEITNTARELEKIDQKLRRVYFSQENKEIRQLKARKSTPNNIDGLSKERSFSKLSASPAFNYLSKRRDELKTSLDALRHGSKELNADKIEQIRNLVQGTENLKEALKNPVLIQKEIARTERELSGETGVQDAAKKLIDSNATIRQFASEKGVDIPELSGYMTHILTQEERARRTAGTIRNIDSGMANTGNPNKGILKQRKYTGSVEDINEKLDRKVFEPNAYFATGVGQQRLIDYIHAVDFRRQVLSNPNFAQKFEKGMDIGKNVVVNSNNYKFLKDTDELADGINLADKVGGDYVVTPQVKMLLDRYQKISSDEGTKAFIKALDGLTGMWKKMALFSPGFHIRNVAGAMWNNYLAGMNVFQLGKYTTQATKEVANALRGHESAMFREFRGQGLGSGGYSQVEHSAVLREPDKAITNNVANRSKDTKGQILQRVNPVNAFQTSREVGTIADQANRFALYKFSRDKGLTPQQAAEKVRESQFDYSALTPFEQKARRVIPFYTWSRKNIPYQVTKFIEDPRKFQKINSLRLNAQESVGLDDENMPDYMKQNFWMPISGSEGKGKMLSLNLPLGDLAKLSNPLKLAADSVTPLIKTPIELASNYNLFKGKPIEQFEGQAKQYRGGLNVPMKTAYGLESMTGQIGRGLSDYFQKPENVDQDNKFRTPSMGINSILKDFDADKNAYFSKVDELKKLQDLIKYIEQQEGVKPRTIKEIKKSR